MSTSLLEARNLTRHYQVSRGFLKPAALVRALDGVSFQLTAKHTLAVVGESGCGKSTLARQLTLIERPTQGELLIDGDELGQADETARIAARRKIQMIFQNPYGSLNPRKKVGHILGEPLLINTTLSRTERDDKVRAMMDKVGLRPEFFQRYPHMFSGGQRQRVAIARALMLNPQVVVADEPVSALDVSIQAQVLNLLMDLQDEFGVAYVFISHDLAVVKHIADEVLVMYLGQPVEQGDKKAIFSQPLHPYTRVLMASAPRLSGEKPDISMVKGELPSPLNPPAGCAFHARCPFAASECQVTRPVFRAFADRQIACHFAEKFV